MKTRCEMLTAIRGESLGTVSENSSFEEKFQNKTLRPILKFQNELFLEVFKNYAIKQKGVFFTFSPEKKNGLYRESYSTRYKIKKCFERNYY